MNGRAWFYQPSSGVLFVWSGDAHIDVFSRFALHGRHSAPQDDWDPVEVDAPPHHRPSRNSRRPWFITDTDLDVWDEAAGRPRIERTWLGFMRECDRWMRENREQMAHITTGSP